MSGKVGAGHGAAPATGFAGGFALILVLFILLAIIGASWMGAGYY